MNSKAAGIAILILIIAAGIFFYQKSSLSPAGHTGIITLLIMPVDGYSVLSQERGDVLKYLLQYLNESSRYRLIEASKSALPDKILSGILIGDKVSVETAVNSVHADKIVRLHLDKKDDSSYALGLSVLDGETAQEELNRTEEYYTKSMSALGKFAAADLINQYPLIGSITGIKNGLVYTDLGLNRGIKNGQRLFAAEISIEKNGKGDILYKEYKRKGIIWINKIDSLRSSASADIKSGLKEGDIVSPDPIPVQQPVIYTQPQLSNIVKGEILLNDDMKKDQLLKAQDSKGESYQNGKFILDSSEMDSGHAYAYYPGPYNDFSDYIIEGEIEFLPVQSTYNKFAVVLRSNASYYKEDSYEFFWNNKGSAAVYYNRFGNIFDLVPIVTTPEVNRGVSVNRFLIKASGNTFDFYINNQFFSSFTDERYDRGAVGFYASSGSRIAIRSIKIWKAVYQK